MAELKAFLHRAGRNELTEQDAIRALLFAFLVFLTLYLPAFRAGYYGEDFAWLAWSRDHSLLDALTPPGGTYFRVLSVRLPYWLFPRLPFGLFLWKTLAFSLAGLSSYFLWRWLELLCGNRGLSLLLAVLYLHSPFQCYPLYYVNAFDYAVLPFALLGFLLAVERSHWRAAFLWLWAGLLAKEWAMAFPVLAFLLRRVPGKVLAAFVVSLPVFAWFSGLVTAGGGGGGDPALAGFSPAFTAKTVSEGLSFFLSRTFLPGFVIAPFFVWGWFAAASATALAGLAGLVSSYQKLLAVRLAAAALVLFGPLFFLSNLKSEFLGGILWVFLFAIASLGLTALAVKAAPVAKGIFLSAVATGLLFFLPAERVELVKKFASHAHVYDFALDRAQLFTANCEPGTKVAWAGLERLVLDQESAEHVLWGLRWKMPGREFFLIAFPGFDEKRVIPAHRSFWIGRPDAKHMLVLETIKTPSGAAQVFSSTGGSPGCGMPGGKNTLFKTQN